MSVWDFDSGSDVHAYLEPDFGSAESSVGFNKYDYEWPDYSYHDFTDLFDDMSKPAFHFANFRCGEDAAPPAKRVKTEDIKPIIISTKGFDPHPSSNGPAKITLTNRSARCSTILLPEPKSDPQPDLKMNFYDDLGLSSEFLTTDYGRRSDHNIKEQQRRRVIANLMEQLRLTVPYTKNLEKATRLKILQESTEFILNFQRDMKKKSELLKNLYNKCNDTANRLLPRLRSRNDR